MKYSGLVRRIAGLNGRLQFNPGMERVANRKVFIGYMGFHVKTFVA
jgi:hypothetical protein